MAYDGWNLLGGFRLLGDSFGGLARWSDGFQQCGCFWDVFGDWVDLIGALECEGFRGSRGAGRPD